jgi:hypothetical protein
MDRVPTALAETARPRWQELVEAAVLARESDNLPQRIRDARSAVMDESEYSFHTADASERTSLINAMNALRAADLATQPRRPGDYKFSSPRRPIGLPSPATVRLALASVFQ